MVSVARKGGPWRGKETPSVIRKPGEYRPGKTERDHGRGKGRRKGAEESK